MKSFLLFTFLSSLSLFSGIAIPSSGTWQQSVQTELVVNIQANKKHTITPNKKTVFHGLNHELLAQVDFIQLLLLHQRFIHTELKENLPKIFAFKKSASYIRMKCIPANDEDHLVFLIG